MGIVHKMSTKSQESSKDVSAKEIWIDWLKNTSFHGVDEIRRPSAGRLWKLLWLLFVAGMTGLVIRGCITFVLSYLDNPTSIEIKKLPIGLLPLPDVIVCTNQRISRRKFLDLGASPELVDGLMIASFVDPFNTIVSAEHRNGGDLEFRRGIRDKYLQFKEEASLTHLFWADFLNLTGMSCPELFLFCSTYLKGEFDCCQNSEIILDQYYGKCHRLRNLGEQNWAGLGAGLTLVLNLSIHSVSDEHHLYSAAKGIQLEIVHPGERGLDRFYQVPISTYATVTLFREKFTKVNAPFKKKQCYEIEQDEHKPSCNQFEWARELNKTCGCAPFGISAPGDGFVRCDALELELNCYANVELYKKLMKRVMAKQQECRIPCVTWTYHAMITYSEIDPSVLAEAGNKSSGPTDYVVLDIRHIDMMTKTMREILKYSPDDVVASVGGIVSLFLGASILSIIQVVCYFLKWVSFELISALKTRSSVDL